MIDYATKYCLAATVTPTSRGADALAYLRRAVVEAERVLDLDDLRADRTYNTLRPHQTLDDRTPRQAYLTSRESQ